MSLITKIAVVLLTVLSLLLTAATVTFVSQVDNLGTKLGSANAELTSVKARLAESGEVQTRRETSAIASASAAQLEVSSLTQRLAQLEKSVADGVTQLAQSSQQVSIGAATQEKLAGALNSSEALKGQFQGQVTELRTTLGQLQTQVGELNVALTRKTNEADVLEQQRRLLTEQLTEAKTSLDRVSGALKDAGVDPSRITVGGVAAGAPKLNGVIRRTEEVAGVPFAAISLGSDDAVRPGMEFKVVDRANGKFLGVLTVTVVQPNEAVGRLSGPDVSSVKAGNDVRTQL